MLGCHPENTRELVGFTWGTKSIMYLQVHIGLMEVGFLALAELSTVLF